MQARAILVIALLALSAACEKYDAGRDAALKQNLSTMRNAIAKYRADNGAYPPSLQALVPRYLPAIPTDPLTLKADWKVTTEETVQLSSDFAATAPAPATAVVIDVRSNAPGADRAGVLYSNY